MTDPFADKKSPWPRIIIAALVLLFVYTILSKMGYIYQWTKGRLGEPRPTHTEAGPKAPSAPDASGKAPEAAKSPEAPK